MITVSRIANASRGELLCITYEMLLEEIAQAVKKQGEDRKRHLEKAVRIIHMLAGDLNFEIPLSSELFRIYIYVQGLLIQGKTEEKLEEAFSLIDKLYRGFKEAAEQEKSKAPSIKNAQSVYAGLTYGKNYHMEEMALGQNERGFRV